MVLVKQCKGVDFRLDDHGVLMFRDRVCVPDVPELKKRILDEGHRSSLSIHPGATNMYQDLKRFFWWPGMKKDIAKFVYACLVCHKSKIEHQKPSLKRATLRLSEPHPVQQLLTFRFVHLGTNPNFLNCFF